MTIIAQCCHILDNERALPPPGERRNTSRLAKGERGIWQRRYWEHTIQDDRDYARHVDYIHYNPVKHGYVQRPVDWPYSSIHHYIETGMLPLYWACDSHWNVDGEFGER
jgi:putative transposase